MTDKLNYKKLKNLKGREVGVSDWMEMTQPRIDSYAECTEDRQWIHIDREKAARSPLKSTVAHGFLLLSLLPFFNSQNRIFSSRFRWAVNYGLNRVRFIHPVKPGDRIRNRSLIRDVTKRGFRQVLVTIENTMEIEGKAKPALVAELLALFYL